MSLVLTVAQTRERLVRRVCPLFAKGGSRDNLKTPPQVGSAVLFRYHQCSVLLTANHVCEEGKGAPLLIRTPGWSDDSTTFVTLAYSQNPWRVLHPAFADADVACIPMPIDIAESVGEMNEYVAPDEVGSCDDEVPGCEATYLLIGFPNTRNKPAVSNPATGRARKGWGNTAFLAEFTNRLPLKFAARSSGSLGAHFAIHAGKKMRLFEGGQVRDAPEFRGMSGGGVWKLHVDPRTQLVERCALVGIFTRRENEGGKIGLVAVRVEWARDYRLWWRDTTPEGADI